MQKTEQKVSFYSQKSNHKGKERYVDQNETQKTRAKQQLRTPPLWEGVVGVGNHRLGKSPANPREKGQTLSADRTIHSKLSLTPPPSPLPHPHRLRISSPL